MIRPKLEFLSPETVGRALDEAYELLWDPGVRVHYDEALDIFKMLLKEHPGKPELLEKASEELKKDN